MLSQCKSLISLGLITDLENQRVIQLKRARVGNSHEPLILARPRSANSCLWESWPSLSLEVQKELSRNLLIQKAHDLRNPQAKYVAKPWFVPEKVLRCLECYDHDDPRIRECYVAKDMVTPSQI